MKLIRDILPDETYGTINADSGGEERPIRQNARVL